MLGHGLRVDASREQRGGAGVPEALEAYVRQPGPPQVWLGMAGHEVRVFGAPAEGHLVVEHKDALGCTRTNYSLTTVRRQRG